MPGKRHEREQEQTMKKKGSNLKLTEQEQSYAPCAAAINRRDFLKRVGKFAAYTPPTLMILMHPSTHAIAQSGGHGRENTAGDRNHFTAFLQENRVNSQNTFRAFLDRLLQLFRRHRAS